MRQGRRKRRGGGEEDREEREREREMAIVGDLNVCRRTHTPAKQQG